MVPLSAPAPNPHTYGVRSLSRSTTKKPGMQLDFVHLHTWLPNFTPNGVSMYSRLKRPMIAPHKLITHLREGEHISKIKTPHYL